MPPKRYLILAAGVFFGFIVLASLDAAVQAGWPTRNGAYSCAYIGTKVARGNAISSPKLVVVSGSNSIVGIDLLRLSRALGVRAFNFGGSASFGPGFQLFEAEKILKRGDAVLMPFEYLAYTYTTPQDSLVDVVYTCGGDYWRALGWQEKIWFVLAAKPQRVVDSALFRARPGGLAKVQAQAARDVGPLGQGSRVDGALPDAIPASPFLGSRPLDIRFEEHSAGVRAIVHFVRWANANGVTVLATWPNTLAFPQYRGARGIADIRAFYARIGVRVIGRPEDGMFPARLMTDTIYHVNREGEIARTDTLVRELGKDPVFVAWRKGSPPKPQSLAQR